MLGKRDRDREKGGTEGRLSAPEMWVGGPQQKLAAYAMTGHLR